MISEYDKNLLKECGQEYLLDIVLQSNYLKETLSFKEHVLLCNQVKKLTYEEVISLTITESIRDFESKFGKFLKYSIAAVASITLGGGLTGPPVAMFLLYLYRKLTDTCVKSCMANMPMSSKKKICKISCQLSAAKKMEHDIRAEISKCTSDKCTKKLQEEYIKWAKRVQLLTVKLNQAKAGVYEKQRIEKQKERLKKVKTLAASFQLSKNQIIKFISENEILRDKLSFKQHVELYYIANNINEQYEPKMVKINPKKEKLIRTGLYLGLWAVPIPFFNDVINYYIKKYDVMCAAKCTRNESIPRNVCYNQCSYLSAKYAVKILNEQLAKCGKSKEPLKCKNSIYKMLEDWKQREVERKIKFESSMKSELEKAKKKNLKLKQKG